MHGVTPHGLGEQQIVNAILHSTGVVARCAFQQLVISCTALIINVRVGMTLALAQVVALNTTHGFFFEFVHVQHEKRH